MEVNTSPNKWIALIGWIISVLATGAFVMSGVMKLVGGAQLEEQFTHLGLPMSMRIPLAVLELTCAAIYIIPQTAVLGAILLAGYMGGAICTHWSVGDPFFVQAIIGVLVWVGIYLREPRLHSLLPIRS